MTKFFRYFLVLLLIGFSSALIAANTPKNIIILFADGVSTPQWEFGRYSKHALLGKPFLVTDHLMSKGRYQLMNTESADYFVTDSAAAASAMSTGYKVNNGAISVTPDGQMPTTLMKFAKQSGKRIGLVSTAPIYDASPAAFSVHAKSRSQSELIVDQYVTLEPEVLVGGGTDYFLPKDKGGKRQDGKDVIEVFRGKGYQVVTSPSQMTQIRSGRLVGLFAPEDIDFEMDRNPQEQPSLSQMLELALSAIATKSEQDKNQDKGFILFVENENTDTAGHRNDVAALMKEMWSFDEAVQVALNFQKKHPDTLLIVTGDHETGGFSPTYGRKNSGPAGKQNYLNVSNDQLRQLASYKMSLDEFSSQYKEQVKKGITENSLRQWLTQMIAENYPNLLVDDDLMERLVKQAQLGNNYNYLPANILAQAIARQTGIYFASSGHTPTPIVVIAYGPGQDLFNGYEDNTQFAKKLFKLMK